MPLIIRASALAGSWGKIRAVLVSLSHNLLCRVSLTPPAGRQIYTSFVLRPSFHCAVLKADPVHHCRVLYRDLIRVIEKPRFFQRLLSSLIKTETYQYMG